MNKVALVLFLSLVANVALAALIYARHGQAKSSSAGGQSVAGNPTAPSSPPPGVGTTPASSAPLLSPADVSYIARLRAGGLPADMIRAIAYARIRDRYRDRIRALQSPAGTSEYWRNPVYGPAPASPEQRARLRELYREQESEVRALLGDGPDSLDGYQKMLRDRMTGYLSNEKIQQVEAIRKDYDELAARVRDQSRGVVLKSDREQFRLLERERRADLAAALTPEELLEYDLRASPTANSVRNRLTYFEPTEEEFRALTKLQLGLDQQFGSSYLSGEEQDRKRAAEKDLAPNIQAVLTPERWAEYQVTIDGMFSETLSFVSSNNLDASVAKEIVALKQSAWRQIDALAGLDAEQRNAALKTIEQDVSNRLGARLGAEVYEKYKRSGAGWMNRLRSTPPPRS